MLNIKGFTGGLIALFIGLIVILESFINLDAGEIAVVQSVFDGELEVVTEPGPKPVWFGKVTRYPKQRAYIFDEDTAAPVQFNDGGTAMLIGSINWNMPLDAPSVLKIHKNFQGADAVEQNAVIKSINSAIYLSGPLMSSTESAGERRSELVQLINDQAKLGVYVTRVTTEEVTDIGGDKRTVRVTNIVRGEDGQPMRQQSSLLAEYNIGIQPLAIKKLNYDNIVSGQIVDRQKATTAVELAKAEALKSEQDAKTAAAKGEADATKAKWEQEVIKAKAVTEAQQKFEVAKLDAQAAEQTKLKLILEGQGEAEKKRLVMQADGALEKKLEAWVKAQGYWANAFKDRQGDIVPRTLVGGNGSNGAASVNSIMDMFAVNQAKQLSLNMDTK